MKKYISFASAVLLFLLLVSCNSNMQEYDFKSQGVKVMLSPSSSLKLSFNDEEPSSAIAVFDSESEEYKGAISISTATDDKTLDELYDLYTTEDCEAEKTLISDKLLFIDTYSVYPASGKPNNWYHFIVYDKRIQVILFGSFSESINDRDTILSLAKSITLEKTEKVSPYPDDYTAIKPNISILSSNEKVTEYCTIPKSWKNTQYDLLSYEKLLADKKVYLLSGYSDNIVFTNGEHKATISTARTSFDDGSLFHEGANGFRIYQSAEVGNTEFYVLVTAEYGSSGELTYVFKCKFE